MPGHGRGFSRVILPTAAVVWCKQRVETTRHESRIHLLLSRNGRALILPRTVNGMCEAMGINHHRVFRQEDMPFIRDRLAYELLMATES